MLGANYLGSTYLGQGWSGVVSPSSVSPVAPWIYATPTTTLQSDEVTQFLTLHEMSVVAQGSPVVTVTGSLNTWQNLGEVDQPFVAPANVGWVRIPVSSTNLAPTTEPGWSNAAPITVQLCEDSGGVPGIVVATTTIPVEQIEAVQDATWPEPANLLFGPAVANTQASLPQLPGVGWTGITSLVAGAWAVAFATQTPNDTQMWVSMFDGSELTGWSSGSSLPVSGFNQIVYAPTAQVLVVLSGTLAWATTFTQDGNVGSWQSFALPPAANSTGSVLGVLTYEGSDYLVVVTVSGATYYALLTSSANVGTWSVGAPFPIVINGGTSYQVGTDLVVIINRDTYETLVSLSSPGGAWNVIGRLVTSSNAVFGIVGTTLITANGDTISGTALTELGIAPWSLLVPFTGSDVTLLTFDTGTEYVCFWIPTAAGTNGWKQIAYLPSWVSVPLPISLTADATYHLVLSSTNDLTTGVAVPVATAWQGTDGFIFVSGSWQPLGGVVPLFVFYGTDDIPLALVNQGKTTVVWVDTPTGAITTTVEIMGSASTSRAMTYMNNVLIEAA